MLLRRHRPAGSPSPSADAAIRLEQVDVHRDRTLALRGVDLTIRPGTATAVIGPNGAGKSTLFGVVSGRLQPSEGRVTIRGAVADVLQATMLDPQLRLTVDDVVRMSRYATTGLLGRLTAADRAACHEALDRVGMLDHRRRPITELSGGQRQRVLVAQGLAQAADILLLDEPANGLDLASQQRILEIIREEADAGRTVLFSTHHLTDAEIADTVIALACACVCCAPPDEALEDPKVTALFERPDLRAARMREPAA